MANDILSGDVLLKNLFPNLGQFYRNEAPEVGLEAFLGSTYIPPRLKALLRTMLPDIMRDYNLNLSWALDNPNAPTTGLPLFTDYLNTLNPFDLLRGRLPETASNSPFRNIFNRPELMGQGGGPRRAPQRSQY